MNEQPKSASRANLKIVLILLGLVVLLCIGLTVVPAIKGTVEPRVTMPANSRMDAWYACTTAVDQKYGVSFLDAQDFDSSAVSGGGPWNITVYYPKTNATFFCEVTRLTNGDMSVIVTH